MSRTWLRLLLCLILSAGVAIGQDVRSLRVQSTDLPRTENDREVLNLFFGSISAVQGACSESLVESLRAEDALAACATYSTQYGLPAEMTRQMVDTEFLMPLELSGRGSWSTPWRENPDFGTVRELTFEGDHYFLMLDHASGRAYVVKFLE